MPASDALVGENLSLSPWKEVLAELEIAKARIAELEAESEKRLEDAKAWEIQAGKYHDDALDAREECNAFEARIAELEAERDAAVKELQWHLKLRSHVMAMGGHCAVVYVQDAYRAAMTDKEEDKN